MSTLNNLDEDTWCVLNKVGTVSCKEMAALRAGTVEGSAFATET